jgi:hypothetical protein
MAVLTGSAGVFSHYPNGYMWTGSGERDVLKYVDFPTSFKRKPSVSAALATVDSSKDANLRVNVSVQDITNDGFNVRVGTWGDTKLAAVSISWIAVEG